jgi:oligopeptide/dipeptide ABC transporter ATP-binding protein
MSGTPPVLRVDDLRTQFRVSKGLGFGHDVLRAVDGVSFEIDRGRTLGLVGESGCGKSTLARTILGLHKPASGSIAINGRDLASLGRRLRRNLREEVQVVFQDPYSSLDPRMTVHEIVAEPLRINRRYDPARVLELLHQVGLPRQAALRRPAEFSGGQRQRIAIARALALRPHLIILDEAVSALDVSIQAQVLNLLKRLQRETGVSYLFISHNLAVVRNVADTVGVMYLGRIVEIGSRERLFGAPLHPYTQALLSAVPVPDPSQAARRRRIILGGDPPNPMAPPSGCGFRTRCWKAAAICANIVPPLASAAGAEHHVACHFAGTDQTTQGRIPS